MYFLVHSFFIFAKKSNCHGKYDIIDGDRKK